MAGTIKFTQISVSTSRAFYIKASVFVLENSVAVIKTIYTFLRYLKLYISGFSVPTTLVALSYYYKHLNFQATSHG